MEQKCKSCGTEDPQAFDDLDSDQCVRCEEIDQEIMDEEDEGDL